MKEKNDQVQSPEQTDNSPVVDVLSDLNTFNTPSSDEVQDDVNETSQEETQEEVAQAKNWLIQDKFEDSEEGRKKLAESYKNLQSKYDKEKPGEDYEKLKKLDDFLKNNPNVVEAMQGELNRMQKNQQGPPEKPEDYDYLEEDTPGTPSYEWRQQYNQYLIDQGKNAAKVEVNALRQEIEQDRATKDKIMKLKAMGMSDVEIEDYTRFMSDDKNITEENLVEIYRFLKAKESGQTVQPLQQKRTSAAAISGVNPPQKKSAEKVKDEFFKGLMKFSR